MFVIAAAGWALRGEIYLARSEEEPSTMSKGVFRAAANDSKAAAE